MPGSTAPATSFFRVSSAALAACSSSKTRRLSTMFRPCSPYREMRNSRTRPMKAVGVSTRRRSICEKGQNARSPATVTS